MKPERENKDDEVINWVWTGLGEGWVILVLTETWRHSNLKIYLHFTLLGTLSRDGDDDANENGT